MKGTHRFLGLVAFIGTEMLYSSNKVMAHEPYYLFFIALTVPGIGKVTNKYFYIKQNSNFREIFMRGTLSRLYVLCVFNLILS